MADLNVRADSVDVEQIMRQIRARIREKRGVDYTESELQQLANVKLEKFLDPRGVRSDLVEQFRKHRVASPAPPNFTFEDTTLYETHRGYLRVIRKLLRPFMLLFFNANRITDALHTQAQINALNHKLFRQREEMDPLFYEVIHNLVVECTRLGVEVHNLKMRVESLGSRLDFDERRGRSLESVVQYKRPERRQESRPMASQTSPDQSAEAARAAKAGPPPPSGEASQIAASEAATGESTPRPERRGRPEFGNRQENGSRQDNGQRADGGRRRRRRRRRRPGQTMGDQRGPGEFRGQGESQGPGGESRGPSEGRGPGESRGPDDAGSPNEMRGPRESAPKPPTDPGASDQ
jgi:hypothetical protein